MTDTGHFEIIEGLPEDVVGIAAHGHITRAAYEDQLIPLIEGRIDREGRINLLYVIGPEFAGMSAGAMWDDARLGLMHLADFARVAVVSDVEWVRMGMKMFAPLLPGRVHVFHMAEMDDAKAWVTANPHEEDHSHDVAADHKLSPLEDKAAPEG